MSLVSHRYSCLELGFGCLGVQESDGVVQGFRGCLEFGVWGFRDFGVVV